MIYVKIQVFRDHEKLVNILKLCIIACMNTKEIAQKFVELYKSDDPFSKYSLYDNECISIESSYNKEQEVIYGLENIKQKHNSFYNQFSEIHSKIISESIISDHGFALTIYFDVTDNGLRKQFTELCVFHVKDGKIIKQEFIY